MLLSVTANAMLCRHSAADACVSPPTMPGVTANDARLVSPPTRCSWCHRQRCSWCHRQRCSWCHRQRCLVSPPTMPGVNTANDALGVTANGDALGVAANDALAMSTANDDSWCHRQLMSLDVTATDALGVTTDNGVRNIALRNDVTVGARRQQWRLVSPTDAAERPRNPRTEKPSNAPPEFGRMPARLDGPSRNEWR